MNSSEVTEVKYPESHLTICTFSNLGKFTYWLVYVGWTLYGLNLELGYPRLILELTHICRICCRRSVWWQSKPWLIAWTINDHNVRQLDLWHVLYRCETSLASQFNLKMIGLSTIQTHDNPRCISLQEVIYYSAWLYFNQFIQVVRYFINPKGNSGNKHSNLCRETPMDFWFIALTTRPTESELPFLFIPVSVWPTLIREQNYCIYCYWYIWVSCSGWKWLMFYVCRVSILCFPVSCLSPNINTKVTLVSQRCDSPLLSVILTFTNNSVKDSDYVT